tara:strand:- start:4087 stop:4983 length:897 start_codon:yes stop_codon:yes gene_type:complete
MSYKNLLISLIYIFSINISNAEKKNKYAGVISTEYGKIISFEINFSEKKGIVKGFSITGRGTDNETKSEITGIYNKNTKTYKLTEGKIIYTKSKINLELFCHLEIEIKEKGKYRLKRYEGTYIGYYENKKICSKGKILLIEKEKLEKKIDKLKNKIEKNNEPSIIQENILKKENDKEIIKNQPITKKNVSLSDGEETSINWENREVTILIWDANQEDGDRITLKINNEIILENFKTKKTKKKIKYKLKENENVIEIYATDIGKKPPNTSMIELVDGKTRYPITAKISLGSKIILRIIR